MTEKYVWVKEKQKINKTEEERKKKQFTEWTWVGTREKQTRWINKKDGFIILGSFLKKLTF